MRSGIPNRMCWQKCPGTTFLLIPACSSLAKLIGYSFSMQAVAWLVFLLGLMTNLLPTYMCLIRRWPRSDNICCECRSTCCMFLRAIAKLLRIPHMQIPFKALLLKEITRVRLWMAASQFLTALVFSRTISGMHPCYIYPWRFPLLRLYLSVKVSASQAAANLSFKELPLVLAIIYRLVMFR